MIRTFFSSRYRQTPSSRPKPNGFIVWLSGETPVFRPHSETARTPVAVKTPVWRKASTAILVCLLGVIMLGAGKPEDPNHRYERLGHEMICQCGCGQVLLECNHVSCPMSGPMIGELHDQLNGPNGTGADAKILNWFVAKYGAIVLAAPIRGGFDDVAWIAPFAVFLFAILGTALLVRKWSQKHNAVRAAAAPSGPIDDAVRERIRRETEY